jgi:DNA-binding MarR family transcriptional regulator
MSSVKHESPPGDAKRGTATKPWTFLTSHAQVLLCLAHDPDVRLRDISAQVGITERAAQRIVADLIEAGYIDREHVGRRNRYTIRPSVEMRHELQSGLEIGRLLDLLQQYPSPPDPL